MAALNEVRRLLNDDYVEREWTVGDGVNFVHNLRKGSPRNPEEHRLTLLVRLKLSRRHFKRHTIPHQPLLPNPESVVSEVSSSAAAPDCGSRGGVALAARRGRFSSAVAHLRNLWLIDGRRNSSEAAATSVPRHRHGFSDSSDSGHSRRQSHEAASHGGTLFGTRKRIDIAPPDSPHAPPPPAPHFLPATVVNAIR